MSRINNFVGYLLSIESKNVFYQGIVSSIDVNRDVMFVKNCFQNGVSCGDKIVEIRISEIEHIDILADASNAMNVLKPKPLTVAPQIEEMPRQSTAKSKQSSMNSRGQNNHHHHHHHQYSEDEISTTNNRRGHNHNHNNRAEKNGLNDVKSFDEEFDFEKNLALFDKNAFYEEVTQNSDVLPTSSQSQQNTPQPSSTFLKILASARTTKPIKLSNSANNLSTTTKSDHQSGKNYRFDEMILDTGEPINFQQIQVPRSSKHYVTDEGYEVPCIDNELRTRLFEESYQQGLSRARQIECMGRNCAEMALQLVGGSIRFSVKNSHQKPAFLVLANSGSLQGSYALCTARLLANRQAKIYVLVYASVGANGGAVLSADELVSRADSAVAFNGIRDERLKLFWSELALLRSSAGDNRSNLRFVSSLDEIQELGSIDMILNGLDANFPIEQKVNASWIKRLAKQIESSKAYVLTIDPSSEASAIQSKWNIAPVLPLEISNQSGRVYLCDLGFTKSMFQAVNIKYESPFGSKFLIPLHDD